MLIEFFLSLFLDVLCSFFNVLLESIFFILMLIVLFILNKNYWKKNYFKKFIYLVRLF